MGSEMCIRDRPLLGFFAVQFKVSNRKLFQGSKTDLDKPMQPLGDEDKPEEHFSEQKQPKQEQQEKWIHARSQKNTVALSDPNSLVQSFLCKDLHSFTL